MPLFRWRAVDDQGHLSGGEIEAESQAEAIGRLRRQGRVVLAVEAVGANLLPPGLRALLAAEISPRRRLRDRECAQMYRELATLLKAGLALDRALDVMSQLGGGGRPGRAAGDLTRRVRSGASLAEAMEATGAFRRFAIGMVRAGETAGALDAVLARLAEFTERSVETRSGIVSALLYPLLLLLAAIGTLVILLTVVLPRFKPMFEQAGTTLPLPTRMVMAAGDAAQAMWWLPLVMVAGGIVVAARRRSDGGFRLRLDRMTLSLPFLGRLLAEMEAARLLRGLATLLANGVPLLPALGILRDTLGNEAAAALVDDAVDNLKRGRGLAEPLTASAWFPRVAVRLVAVGEETGRLDETSARAADLLDGRTRQSLARMLTLLGPLMTLVLGLLVAGVIAAILLAILDVNELVL